MPYYKQNWIDGSASTPLSASRLNHLETGVKAVSDAADEALGAVEGRLSEANLSATVAAAVEGIGASPEVGEAARVGDAWWSRVFAPPASSDTPTVTVAATTSGTVTPATTDVEADPSYRYDGLAVRALETPFTGYVRPAAALSSAYRAFRVHFVTSNLAVVDIAVRGISSGAKGLRILVNDRPLSMAMQTVTLSGAAQFLRLAFPVARARKITVEWTDDIAFGGVALTAGQSVTRAPLGRGPRVAFLGDSFTAGANTVPNGAGRLESYAWFVARLLGASEWVNLGIGGSGYATSTNPYGARVPLVEAFNPDVLIVQGTRNDGGGYEAVLSAARAMFARLDWVPNVYVTGPSTAAFSGNNEAVREAVLRSGFTFLDGIAEEWIADGDLWQGESPSPIHPTFAGHQKLARGMYAAIRRSVEPSFVVAATSATPPAPQLLTAGSLVHLSAKSLPAGVPAHNALLPNLAWQQAASLIGSGTEETLKSKMLREGNTSTTLVMERTVKGGLHGIFSPTTTTESAAPGNFIYSAAQIADLIVAFLIANPTHHVYVDLWGRTTRAGTAAQPFSVMANKSAATSNFLYQVHPTLSQPDAASGQQLGAVNGVGTVGLPQRRSIGTTGFRGTPGAAPANIDSFASAWGNASLINRNPRGGGASWVFYDFYLEDITASGRTFAQVDAIRAQMFDQEFAPGGAYAGDLVPTDPATVP